MQHQIRTAVVFTAIMAAVGSTSVAELTLSASAAAAHEVSNKQTGYAGPRISTTPSTLEVRDSRVREFLQWKQRIAANERVR